MGEHSVNHSSGAEQRKAFIRHLLNDVQALERMLDERLFESGIQRIGAEQEFCLVDADYRPSLIGPTVLAEVNDPHFTTELAKYNLEINLDPLELKGRCFSDMEKQLKNLLARARAVSAKHNQNVILTGILPTVRASEVALDYMTPNPRYDALSNVIREIRGNDFELHIQGVDELMMRHESILFEACNTSFQVHLQIHPDEFVDQFNWAQAIAGPVLAAAVNSPLLLGKELWCETRIALFQQSIDMRSASHAMRERQPRVAFGTGWVRNSVVDIYKEDIARYTLLLTQDVEEDSLVALDEGNIPGLTALRLHNGTIYKWNRACYGVGGGVPHLRIENRYLPSGPTPQDEMANAVFWVGLMKGMPQFCKNLWENMDFEEAKGNFIKAGRTGLETEFDWFGELIPARNLIRETLIPMAREGLLSCGIDPIDIDRYLGIIRQRVESGQTGTRWIVRSYRKLRKSMSKDEALVTLTAGMHERQHNGLPVAQWNLAEAEEAKGIAHKYDRVDKLMATDLYTVHEGDLAELVANIMEWNGIHHVPVENSKGQLTGLITAQMLEAYISRPDHDPMATARDVMERDFLTIQPEASIEKATRLMNSMEVDCLPVVQREQLIGIITDWDISQLQQKASPQA